MPKGRAEEDRAKHIEAMAKERASNESAEQLGLVRYIGLAHVRRMSQEDLQIAGFSGNDLVDLEWNRGNQWTVKRSDIPDAVYESAIAPDNELVLVDGEGQRM